MRGAITRHPDSWLAQASGGDPERVTLSAVAKAADEGDPIVLAELRKTAEWLGIGIASLLNILNPERVVFGGPLSIAHEHLLPTIQSTVEKRAWQWVGKEANIVIADFGQDAAVIGGVALVYRELLNHPRNWLKLAQQAL